jgi:hypothetical protein
LEKDSAVFVKSFIVYSVFHIVVMSETVLRRILKRNLNFLNYKLFLTTVHLTLWPFDINETEGMYHV